MMFCEFLTDERTRRKMDMISFAELLEVSEATISRWESGHMQPKRNSINKINEKLGTNFQEYESQPFFKKSNVSLGDHNALTHSSPVAEPAESYQTALALLREQLDRKDQQISDLSRQLTTLLDILKSK